MSDDELFFVRDRNLDYPVFDADNHMYENPDAFTKFIPPEYEGIIKYVEYDRRAKLSVKDRISRAIPNPTFQRVAPPGGQQDDPLKRRSIAGLDAFFDVEPRYKLMQEFGISRALMWPTLASVIEQAMPEDPLATHAVLHALNEWMYEHWTFGYEDTIFPTPAIGLALVDRAIKELEWVVERGAKAILVRPAPVPDFNGRRRSFALPEFDPFWEKVVEADVVVGMHASDSGFQRYVNEWEGHDGEFLPFNTKLSGFYHLLHADNRMISDVVTSIIGHGLATRFPELRIMPVENGSAWVRPLVERFEKNYERAPKVFDEDPMVAFKRCIHVHPFHEEDPVGLVKLIGPDNVLFGSDFPHPEGMYDPIGFVDQLDGLPEDQKAKVMGGNLNRIMKVPVAA